MSKRLLMTVALSLIVGALTFSAWPAHDVNASCYGSGCSGQDPEGQGCSSTAYNLVSTVYTSIMEIDLRYSSGCVARWSRIKQGTNGYGQWVRATIRYPAYSFTSSRYTTGQFQGSLTSVWSPMQSPDASKACGSYRDGSGETCTGAG